MPLAALLHEARSSHRCTSVSAPRTSLAATKPTTFSPWTSLLPVLEHAPLFSAPSSTLSRRIALSQSRTRFDQPSQAPNASQPP